MSLPTPFGKRQRGIATVELVIVAPFLLLLMLMVSELGRALYQYHTLAKAVRDGARYYSSPASFEADFDDLDHDAIVQRTRNLITYGNVTGSGTPLLPGNLAIAEPVENTLASGIYATVSASYTFQFLPGNPLSGVLTLLGSSTGLPSTLTLTSSATMRMI